MEFTDGFAAPVEMEYGGYVEPPSYLTKKQTQQPTGVPAELRTVPDYDYSLFRRSRMAAFWLGLILLLSALLIGLTLWQGPWGPQRGANGVHDAEPIEYQIADYDSEGGSGKSLRNIRISQFVIGFVGLVLAIFGIRSRPAPGKLKGMLMGAMFLIFVAGVLAFIAMAFSIEEIDETYECDEVRIHHITGRLMNGSANNSVRCHDRAGHQTTAACIDAFLGAIAFLTAFGLFFTTKNNNWAWGPGRVSIQNSPMRPTVSYPPPSPFTHIHQTRRKMVWLLLAAFAVLLIASFVMTIVLHELRIKPTLVDNNNREIMQTGGWAETNNVLRLSLAVIVFVLALLLILDLHTWRLRWSSYMLAALLFFAAIGLFVVFAMDVHDLDDINDKPCSKPPLSLNLIRHKRHNESINKSVHCNHAPYIGTCIVDFLLALIVLIFVLLEFVKRAFGTWDTHYFYADSEWLEKRALIVEATDREAWDWRKRPMETGRFYYYSPTLGLATRQPPRNYVDPDAGFTGLF